MSINVRESITKLFELGPLPDETDDENYSDNFFEEYEALLDEIEKPINSGEARLLVQLFPNVSCYGLDWTLLHLIESTPQWPIYEIIESCQSAEWKQRMISRLKNKS